VKEVGIKMSVETVTKAKQDELIFNNDYHVLTLSWSGEDPTLLNIIFNSRNIPRPGKFGFNWNQIKSPELDRLLAQADTTVDPERRSQILTSIQKLVLEKALAFPIHPLIQTVVFRRSIRNLVFAQTFYQVWFYDAEVSR
jgi:peptide/nickel transport system substrate-binding protein